MRATPPRASATPTGAPSHGALDTPVDGRHDRYTAALDASAALAAWNEAGRGADGRGGGDDDFVSLGDWLRDEEGAEVHAHGGRTRTTPTGDEQADFADMLKKFKQGVAENVDSEDHEAHYDLGVAYKEMGLLDEAISEFQKALRGQQNRLRTLRGARPVLSSRRSSCRSRRRSSSARSTSPARATSSSSACSTCSAT